MYSVTLALTPTHKMFDKDEPGQGWQCLPQKTCSRGGNLSRGRHWLAGFQRSPSSLQLSEAVNGQITIKHEIKIQ